MVVGTGHKTRAELSDDSNPSFLRQVTSRLLALGLYSVAGFGFVFTLVFLASFFVQPTLHSCEVYFPHPLSAALSTLKAVFHFVKEEGILALLAVLAEAISAVVAPVGLGFGQPSTLDGKNILMIGGSYVPQFFDRASQLGVNLILVDDSVTTPLAIRSQASLFVPIKDFAHKAVHSREEVIAVVQAAVETADLALDGCFTAVEDNGPLAAEFVDAFELPGTSAKASTTARNKFQVREAMTDAGLPTPKYALVNSAEDLAAAAEIVGFPAFLKPTYGVAAANVNKIYNATHLAEVYSREQESMDPEKLLIFHFGKQMMLESMMGGYEIQLELLVKDSQVIFSSVSSQYAPDRSWLVFPTNLTEMVKSELVELASNTVKAVGLSHGLVHVELFYDPSTGPQIIEINNRLSRGFLALRTEHQMVFGEKKVDYFRSVLFLAVDEVPPLSMVSTPVISLAVFPDAPSKAGWETHSPCGVFISHDPAEALEKGLDFYFADPATANSLEDDAEVEL